MPYDLFISYAHQGDNTSREAVNALVARLHAELEADFRRRFGRDLEIFFDKENIRDFEHWQVSCHRALQTSRFFIACLSRTYLRSDACRWEWEEWCRHELEHGLVGQGAASLWFVKLEDLDAPEDAALLRRWKGDLLQRFHIQCHEWRHDDHGNFLDAAARSELQQLTEHVAQRLRLLTLDRARRGNLPWPNANFVGREPELASLRAALLDAPEQSPSGIHGVGGIGKTALAQAVADKEAHALHRRQRTRAGGTGAQAAQEMMRTYDNQFKNTRFFDHRPARVPVFRNEYSSAKNARSLRKQADICRGLILWADVAIILTIFRQSHNVTIINLFAFISSCQFALQRPTR